MLPKLKPGRIVVARRSRAVRPGDVVIIEHNGLEKVKRVQAVQDGQLFVLGDNPTESTDSRSFGWLPLEVVRAKIIWPR